MKLEAIRNEVENLIDDPSYDADTIDSYINHTLAFAAGQVNLPSLKRISTVATVVEQAYVSLLGVAPDFSGVLRRVKRANGDEPLVYPDLERLLDDYPEMDKEGAVEATTLEGSVLWYQKIPVSPETLTILFYENPSPLLKGEDIPSDFPVHTHRKLFVHGTAFMIFDQIEDGIEGDKINSKQHFYHSFDERSRDSGITKLREWLARTTKHHISSVWRY
jgi:hypothetical protein